MHPPPSTISLRQVCHVLFRHRKQTVITFFLVMVFGIVVTVFMPRTYRAQAKLLIRLGRENATLDPTANFGQAPVVAVPASREYDINSALEIPTSPFLLEKVVAAVGPETILGRAVPDGDQSARQLAVTRLSRKLEVAAVKKSNIITLTYDGSSPEAAQTVVSHLVDFYLDRYARLHRTPGVHRFLAEQAERLHTQLTATEEELRRRKEETGLFAPVGQRQTLVTRLAMIEDDLLKTAASQEAAEAEIKALRTRLNGMPQTGVSTLIRGRSNQYGDLLRGQLFALRQKELDLMSRHGADHTEVRLVREQVAVAQELVDREEKTRDEVTTAPSRTYEESQIALLKSEILRTSLQARTEVLCRQKDQQVAALQAVNRDELRIARLQRDLDLQTLQYRKYVESREQAEIDQSLETKRLSNISVVQPATADLEPVRPRPLLYLAITFVMALVASFGLALLSEKLDGSLKTPAEVEAALGMPVL